MPQAAEIVAAAALTSVAFTVHALFSWLLVNKEPESLPSSVAENFPAVSEDAIRTPAPS